MIEELLVILRDIHPWLVPVAGLSLIVIVAWLGDVIVKRRLQSLVRVLASKSSATWDDALVQHKVFARLAHLIPAVCIYFGVALIPELGEQFVIIVRNVALAFGLFTLMRALSAMLSAINTIYESKQGAVERPIKGYIQVAKLIAYALGTILIISALIDKSPLILLSGFGAMTAVLLLVFKDTILSLVASVQLSSLDMIRVGDWIEMPQFNADGDVIDIALHTVRIQNWDKTITTIPTHRLISESFMNWRGMQDAGGRRIKRSISIDMQSVRFLSEEEIKHFSRFALLKDYIEEKSRELADYNNNLDEATAADVNMRRLSNLGTLRAYLINYLRHHKSFHGNMTLLVRQLQPTSTGIPIEIYCFTTTTSWSDYEDIQADLFDHLLSILPEFGLRVYQAPGGADFQGLLKPDQLDKPVATSPTA